MCFFALLFGQGLFHSSKYLRKSRPPVPEALREQRDILA